MEKKDDLNMQQIKAIRDFIKSNSSSGGILRELIKSLAGIENDIVLLAEQWSDEDDEFLYDRIFMTAIANSTTAMTAILNSTTAMTAIANSTTAMTAILNSTTVMTAILNSTTAMTAIANSYEAIKVLSKASDDVLRSSKLNTILYNDGKKYFKLIHDTIQNNKSKVRIVKNVARDNDSQYNQNSSDYPGESCFRTDNGYITRLMRITNIDTESYLMNNLERSISGSFSNSNGYAENIKKFTPVYNGDESENCGVELFMFGSCTTTCYSDVFYHYIVYELN